MVVWSTRTKDFLLVRFSHAVVGLALILLLVNIEQLKILNIRFFAIYYIDYNYL